MASKIKVSSPVGAITIRLPVENFPGLGKVFETIRENNINIWLGMEIVNHQGLMSVTLCVDSQDFDQAVSLIKPSCPGLQSFPGQSLTIISVFPFRDNPDIAFRFIKALEDASVPVLAVSTSLSSVSGLIAQEHCLSAQKSLETAFGIT